MDKIVITKEIGAIRWNVPHSSGSACFDLSIQYTGCPITTAPHESACLARVFGILGLDSESA
jgi:hypothetical protein